MSDQTFLLPDLGEGLTEADIVRWLVSEGDTVVVDQSIVEVETAKSVVEVPSPYAGVVASLHAAEGTTLDVGKPLITVASATPSPDAPAAQGAAASYREEERAGSGNVLIGYGTSEGGHTGRRRRPRGARAGSAPAKAAGLADPLVHPLPSEHSAPATKRVPLVISPLVRNLARERGLRLDTIEASGAGGVITRADVERSFAARSAAPALPAVGPADGERRIPLSGFRKAAAAALSRSRSEIPEATVWVDVDATALWELRERTRAAGAPGPGLLAYLSRFTVAALKQYPVLNARLDTERQEIVQLPQVNLGIAVQGDRGLVAPAVIGADTMTTSQLDTAIRRLTATAREGRNTAEELSAGTFTLNNYGSFRVDGSAAIINHPQVAILGFGRILDRPWVVDGQICARKITQMSFVFDHRVCDGGTAAGFMRCVADAVEDPAAAIAGL
ncbi:dihydrolipoamide acetyltransferase family protein [Allobranchiibius sp. CTAmp26]|uniref:dihydrolipoamide acetyltransferase family protein n=1 Tax=Allobranchiibius sp. CTAmp26 TaxID=2815214 RepID=UPI001AA14396|nr:dihydrolipoamide acetyltransferase family protein [Allobranchiibius sp. CTAmp26]MBO1756437.1 2-oxo acid dehydrogenase subunit E2 [Allobranchiibius sp. CTAmp26]